jgi:hypothetical protein
MSFSTGLKLGPALFTGQSTGAAPHNTPQTSFFGTSGGFFLENNPDESKQDLQNTQGGSYKRVGVIPCAGAKSVIIQPMMQTAHTVSTITDSSAAAASDITDAAKRVGFEVYAAKPIGDPAILGNDDRMVWSIGFIQSISWTKSGFALATSGTEITHPDDSNAYAPYVNGGVADITVTTVGKFIPHVVPATMSSAATAQPDITDGTSTSYTGTADASFCNITLGPFTDCLYLAPCTTNDTAIKRDGLYFSYRFALLY